MSQAPLINVLCPTYEPREEHLRAAIESLLAQTEQRWTLLVHDDASSKDVHAIIDPYFRNGRITYVHSRERLGIGGNWNACLQYGQAPYVQYLFQDDLWEPQYLEQCMNILEKYPRVGFVSAEHAYKYEGDVPNRAGYEEVYAARRAQAPGVHNKEAFLQWWIRQELRPNVIGEPSFVMLRRSLLEQTGPFIEDMPQFLDVEMWLRCLQHGDWYYIGENLGTFRVHGAGASAQNEESGSGIFDRFRCFQKLIGRTRGDLRKEAVSARNTAFEKMVQKFMDRKKSGKRVSTNVNGGWALKLFALLHPLLVIRSLHQVSRRFKSPAN